MDAVVMKETDENRLAADGELAETVQIDGTFSGRRSFHLAS